MRFSKLSNYSQQKESFLKYFINKCAFFGKQTKKPTPSFLFLKSNLQLECFLSFSFFQGLVLVAILLEIFLVSCPPLLQRRQEQSTRAAPVIPMPDTKDRVPSQPSNQESPCHSKGHECSLQAGTPSKSQTVPTAAKTQPKPPKVADKLHLRRAHFLLHLLPEQ